MLLTLRIHAKQEPCLSSTVYSFPWSGGDSADPWRVEPLLGSEKVHLYRQMGLLATKLSHLLKDYAVIGKDLNLQVKRFCFLVIEDNRTAVFAVVA